LTKAGAPIPEELQQPIPDPEVQDSEGECESASQSEDEEVDFIGDF